MKTETKPWISGFCNRTLPRTPAYDPHERCRGCDCACHTPTPEPEEIPVPMPADGLEELLAEHVYTYPDTFCACGAFAGASPWRDWPAHLAEQVRAAGWVKP